MVDKKPIEHRQDSLEKLKQQADLIQQQETEVVEVPETNAWGLSAKGMNAIKKGVEMYQTKHGLYSSVPMICKEDDCQYAEVCPLLKQGLVTRGERCPLEISLIITRYDAYKSELGIRDEDAVDMSLLKDLIDCEVQILRAENKMAIEGDFVKDVLTTVTERGDEIFQEQISQAALYKEKIQAKRNRILELLNSTRKNKSGERLGVILDPSSYARQILEETKPKIVLEETEFEELEAIEEPEYLRNKE